MRTTRPHVKHWKWGSLQTKWVVDGLRDENGKRVRRFFASRDAANEWLSQRRPELRDQGRAAMGMTDVQRVDAVRALSILAPYGASLTAAAEAFAERAQLLSRTVTFAELRTELVAAKRSDRKSAQYLHDLTHRLSKAGEKFDEQPVATIEARDLDDWFRALPLSPTSRFNYRKVLRTAFEFAVTRGYARDNPVVKTATVKIEHAVPGILTPTEIAALLSSADPRIVPAIAISAFAGLRDAEVGRMTWDMVDLAQGYIKVGALIAKTASRRVIPIAGNLRAWLMLHAKHSGPIRPSWRISYRLYRAARSNAVEALGKVPAAATNLETWPSNALRHSFSSYRMAVVGNAVQVAEECGHSVQVMKTHYRELVTPADAKTWFAVVPETTAGNVIAFSQREVG